MSQTVGGQAAHGASLNVADHFGNLSVKSTHSKVDSLKDQKTSGITNGQKMVKKLVSRSKIKEGTKNPTSKSLETKQRQGEAKLQVIPETNYTAKGQLRRDLHHISGAKSNSSQQRRGNSSASEKSNSSASSH
jgi:hypothetical protein